MTVQDDEDVRRRSEFLDQRRALDEVATSESQLLDRSVVTLLAGSLVLSITFIGNIIGSKHPTALWLLAGSWVLLIAALLATLLSLRFAVYAHRAQLDILDQQYQDDTLGSPVQNPWNTSIDLANWISIGGMALGFCCLALFATLNLGRNEMPKTGSTIGSSRPSTTLGRGMKPLAPPPRIIPVVGKPATPPPPPPPKKK
jgi:hypothetical protein